MSYLLLTGATGLLGQYVLCHLMLANRRAAVLVRPGKLATPRDRIEAVLAHWEAIHQRALPRPVVIAADLRESNLGLSAADERWISEHCDGVLHSAASMVFRRQADGEPLRTNIEGTRHVLELCRRTGVRQFHHVSTAYLCGLRTGRVLETELDLGQEPGNIYEESKLGAEKLVRAADWLDVRTVYRPASIVGDSRTGYTTSYHGFYLPLQLAYTMSGRIPPDEMGNRFFARLGLRGHEGKNFVPIDWVAAAMAHLLMNPRYHGQTYHLASSRPVPIQMMQRVVQDSIRKWSKRKTATHASEQDLATCEKLFEQHMEVYRSHWRDDPVFDLTNSGPALAHLPCPEMDYEQMLRIAQYPIEHNFATPRHQAIQFEFDTDQFLSRFQFKPQNGNGSSRADTYLGLQIDGSGGGQWHLRLHGEHVVQIGRGLGPAGAAVCCLTTQTLSRLVERSTTLERSIQCGRVLLEAPPKQSRQLLATLQQVITNESLSGKLPLGSSS